MFIRGPEIVRDGLILCLDAANSKSFRGEPTENLFSTFSSNENNATLVGVSPIGLTCGANANWDRCNYGGGTYEYNHVETINPYGEQSLVGNLIVTVAGGDYRSRILDIGATTLNRTFTFSIWVKNNGGSDTTLSMSIRTSGDTNGITVAKTITNEWQRLSITNTFTGSCTSEIRSYLFSLDAGMNILLYGAQLEEKPYATDFVNGTRGATVATGGGYKDLTRNANNYTLVGDVISQDNHLYFSGDQDYFQPDNNSSFNSLTEMTLESWCYPMRSSPYEYLFSNARDTTQAGLNGYEMRMFNGTPRITIWNNGSGNTAVSSVSTPINNWYHIAGTYSGTQLKIYVNGVLKGTTNSTLGIGTPSSYDLYIGRMGYGAIYEYQGYIDVSKVYNRALSDNEILQNYNALKSRFGL